MSQQNMTAVVKSAISKISWRLVPFVARDLVCWP